MYRKPEKILIYIRSLNEYFVFWRSKGVWYFVLPQSFQESLSQKQKDQGITELKLFAKKLRVDLSKRKIEKYLDHLGKYPTSNILNKIINWIIFWHQLKSILLTIWCKKENVGFRTNRRKKIQKNRKWTIWFFSQLSLPLGSSLLTIFYM